MKIISILILVFILSANSNAQQSISAQPKNTIQEISLLDSILVKEINILINDTMAKDSVFHRAGYVEVFLGNYPYKDEKVRYSYLLGINYSSQFNTELSYPAYYSFISGKMIIIRDMKLLQLANIEYSKASKRKFLKKIRPYFTQLTKDKFRKSDGEVVTISLRKDETVGLHNKKVIFIFSDAKLKPVIMEASEAGIY